MLAPGLAWAGPWIRDPGASYVKLGASSFVGVEPGSTGMMEMPTQYADLTASAYGELGLPLGLEVAAYLPYVVAQADDGAARFVSYGGGDAELGLGKRLLASPVAISLATVVKVPLYTDRGDFRVATYGGYASRFSTPGDGQVDVDARLGVGGSFRAGATPGWVQGSLGYRHRTGVFVDGVPWLVQAGLSPARAGRPLGFAGVEASGLANVEADPRSRAWTRLGAFVAVNLGRGLALEAWGGAIPWAYASRAGGGGGLGLSSTRDATRASTPPTSKSP